MRSWAESFFRERSTDEVVLHETISMVTANARLASILTRMGCSPHNRMEKQLSSRRSFPCTKREFHYEP
ncbi:MAG: hypothetical protein BWX71_02315 [Deltaproteobacteria bacterium ADurb.Bin072]|nr:MAG: hypothetical protein BWX71_02315 [Deltaproteobacteria bacterium ADurb.Bin072]